MFLPNWVLDPKGNVVLVLKHADAECAQCEKRPKTREGTSKQRQLVAPTRTSELALSKAETALKAHQPTAESLQARRSSRFFDTTQNPYGWSCFSDEERCEVRMRLSSRHLCLASPVFQRMLEGPWEKKTDSQSLREVEASEWNPEALLIVLNIVHNRHSAVPKSITQEMLGEIALIVDYYSFHEPMEIFGERWIPQMATSLPTSYGALCVNWLFISVVFCKAKVFRDMATLFLKHGTGPIETELPIPAAISDALDSFRVQAIAHAFEAIAQLQQTLQHQLSCSEACSSLLLGSLMRQLSAKGLDPRPESPFQGFSITAVREIVGSIRNPERTQLCPGPFSRCKLEDKLRATLAEMDKATQRFVNNGSRWSKAAEEDWAMLKCTIPY